MFFRFQGKEVNINIKSKDALIDAMRSRWQAGKGFALATINLDHMVKLRTSPEFLNAYLQHDLVCADGNPVVWLSKLAHKPVELVPGADMVRPMCQAAAQEGVRVALVGSTDESLAKAARILCAENPGLAIPLLVSPQFGFDPDGQAATDILNRLNDAEIGLCLIALGAPKQELFAARGRQIAPKVGFASIGAGIDFIAGHQNRAPSWVRAVAGEWLWRALSSPKRMVPRYAKCIAILPSLTNDALRTRKGS